MTEQISVHDDILRAFELMWGNYPISTMLIHKNRTILAVNKAGAERIKPGVMCFSLTGRSSICPHCEGNEAVRDKEGRHEVSYNWPTQQLRDCYWIPLVGHEDIYVHFGINITPYARPDICAKHKKIAENINIAVSKSKNNLYEQAT